MSRPRRLVTVLLPATLILLAGCVPTGERPSLGAEVAEASPLATTATGVPEADALLERLDDVGSRTFTVEYTITRKLGGIRAEAAVAQAPPRRTVRVGSTVFLTGEEVEDQTCSTNDNLCEPGIIEQRVSDLGIASGFYGPSQAAQLRVSVGRRVGDVTASTRQVGGVTADCVAVAVTGGTETYCVSPFGPVAYVDTAAYTIEMTAGADTADPAALLPPSPTTTVAG